MITFISLARSLTCVAHPLVSVRFPPQLLADSERIVKDQGYASTQEFIREAVRRQVQEQNLANLKRLAGIGKGQNIKSLTRAERDAIALDFLHQSPAQRQALVDKFMRPPGTQADFEAFLAERKKKR